MERGPFDCSPELIHLEHKLRMYFARTMSIMNKLISQSLLRPINIIFPLEPERYVRDDERLRQTARLLKNKLGLVGFANGSKVAAMADTGSRKNVMSESYAKKLNLNIEGSPSVFEIGSSKKIQSLGRSKLHEL